MVHIKENTVCLIFGYVANATNTPQNKECTKKASMQSYTVRDEDKKPIGKIKDALFHYKQRMICKGDQRSKLRGRSSQMDVKDRLHWNRIIFMGDSIHQS